MAGKVLSFALACFNQIFLCFSHIAHTLLSFINVRRKAQGYDEASCTSLGALGELIEQLLGITIEKTGYSRAVMVWNKADDVFRNDPITRQAFLSALNKSQSISLFLLNEWWTGAILHDPITNPARKFIFSRSKNSNLTALPGFSDADRVSILDSNIESSYYHHKLVELFFLELGASWRQQPWLNPSFFAESLEDARREAAIYAAAQRIAMRFAGSAWYPAPPSASSKESWIEVGKGITATVDACPWLTYDQRLGLPFYLWDVEHQRTVKTEELEEEAACDYICISHTWGRWLIEGSVSRVDGVPWSVPDNRIFSVVDLPQRLKAAQLPAKYVWLDLFCIPQDRSKKAREEIARQATIFINAKYCACWLNTIMSWDGLEKTVRFLSWRYLKLSAWGAGVSKDDGESQVILPPSAYLNVPAEISHKIQSEAQPPTGLFPLRPPSKARTVERLCGWFTSLWTLQEYCLRPDMMLLDANLNRFHGPDSTTLSLDDLIALTKVVLSIALPVAFMSAFDDDFESRKPSEANDRFSQVVPTAFANPDEMDDLSRWPKGPLDVLAMVELTGMISMEPLEPTIILQLGERRQCSGRRAEAIMSVLGTTEWYEAMIEDADDSGAVSETNLVFDKYPVAFLQEVAKMAPFFFGSTLVPLHDQRSVLSRLHYDMDPIGSLLPLRPRNHFFHRDVMVGFPTHRALIHESVKSWIIRSDGAVVIPKAAIVDSTAWEESPVEALSADVSAPILGFEGAEGQRLVRLQDWLRDTRPDHDGRHLHAVLLCRNAHTVGGVLLYDLAREEPRRLVQVGTWFGMGNPKSISPMSETLTVDWLVL